jgi:hypothetical protein
MTFIYYLHTGNNIPLYIGKTVDLKQRTYNHRRNIDKNAILEVLDLVEDNEWRFWETHYISLFRSWGFSLINKNNGGGGCNFHNDVIRKKISDNKKLSPPRDNTIKNLKISKANKGRPSHFKGKKASLEVVLKRSKSNKVPVLQMKDDLIIKEWGSVSEANKMFSGVHNALCGRAQTAHGFEWRYKYINKRKK